MINNIKSHKIKTVLNFSIFPISILCFIACGSVYLDGDGYLRPNPNNRKTYENAYGTQLPKEPNFSLKGKLKEYKGEFLIDTTTVYINNMGEAYAGPYYFENVYTCVRFFSSGHILFKTKHGEKFTDSDFSIFKNDLVGFYTFKNGKILIEIFDNTGQYRLYEYIKIDSTTIKQTKTKPHSIYSDWIKKEEYFYKRNVDSLWGEPYW